MRCDECKWGVLIPGREMPARVETSEEKYWWRRKTITRTYPAHTFPEVVVCHQFFPENRPSWTHDGVEVESDWFCRKWEP
jgi:hypothetical protein